MSEDRFSHIKGYSIWLHGGSGQNSEYQRVIRDLQAQMASPFFPPHITLLGQIQFETADMLIEMLRAFAQTCSCFKIRFNKVRSQDDYFRICYLETEEDSCLRHWRQELAVKLQIEDRKDYIPHLSLYYGDQQSTDPEVNNAAEHLLSLPFEITQISLIKTEGPVKDWKQECLCELI